MLRGGRDLVASMKKSESSDFILTWEVFGAKGHHVREKAADNEFEEFLKEDWSGLGEDEDAPIWEDNWNDDNIKDDVFSQLQAELEKHG